MARSRRRSAGRQNSSMPSLMTWGKIVLIALGMGGGTYGVFRAVSTVPQGTEALSEGVEVGDLVATDTDLAMARKPAFPDADSNSTIAGGGTPRSLPASLNAQSRPPIPTGILSGGNSGQPTPAPTQPSFNQTANDLLPAALTQSGGNPAQTKPDAGPDASLALGNLKAPNSALPAAQDSALSASPKLANALEKTSTQPAALAPSGVLPPAVIAKSSDSPSLLDALKNASAAGAEASAPNSALDALSPRLTQATPSQNPNSMGSPGLLGQGNNDGLGGGASRPDSRLPGLLTDSASPNPMPNDLSNPATAVAANPAADNFPSGDATGPTPLLARSNPADSTGPSGGLGPRLPMGGATQMPRSSGGENLSGLPQRTPASNLPVPEVSSAANTAPQSPLGFPQRDLAASPTSFPVRSPDPISAQSSSLVASQDNRNTDSRAGGTGRMEDEADLGSTMIGDRSVQPATYPTQQDLRGDDSGSGNTPRVAAANRAPSSLISNVPGDPQWEIQQAAALILEKRAPEQVQVNVPATFQLAVRNVGRAVASQVLVRDRIPQGTRLISATPKPSRQTGDLLEWDFPTISPNDTIQIQLELLPIEPGELGSVAEVSMAAVAACRTRCTKPNLVIEHTAPPQVMVGQPVVMNITVRNDGDGPAENVVIRETVPSGLSHPSGQEIENPLGRLLPGQSRTLQLALRAQTPGQVRNTVRASGDGKLSSEHSIDVEIVSPQLSVAANGPNKRYLQREATHQFTVQNNGTANATNVQMMAQLPRGLKYESSAPAGRYDPARHAVFWAMQQLPSGGKETLALTTLPLAPGEQPIEFQALADLNQPQATTQNLLVEQLSELFFDVDDLQDPIEVNSNTTYVVRVENQGSQVANDVALVVDLPAGIEALNVEAPTAYQIQPGAQGARIVFAPIAVLNPKSQQAIRIEVKGVRDGDHTIEVQMTSAQRPTTVAKQESTKVYSDRIR